jgi:hypothetical protein
MIVKENGPIPLREKHFSSITTDWFTAQGLMLECSLTHPELIDPDDPSYQPFWTAYAKGECQQLNGLTSKDLFLIRRFLDVYYPPLQNPTVA